MVRQRVRGLPLEQIVGWAEFAGLRIAIEPGVFVPRRRTELLLRQALRLAPAATSGCRAVLRFGRRWRSLWRRHCRSRAVRHRYRPGCGAMRPPEFGSTSPGQPPSSKATSMSHCRRHWSGRVDLLLANAPYVPTDSIALMPPEARLYEPRVALDGGSDGLDVHRRIIAGATRWLAPHGRLLVETSRNQAPAKRCRLRALWAGGPGRHLR